MRELENDLKLKAKIFTLGEWYSCRVLANSGVSTLGLKRVFLSVSFPYLHIILCNNIPIKLAFELPAHHLDISNVIANSSLGALLLQAQDHTSVIQYLKFEL